MSPAGPREAPAAEAAPRAVSHVVAVGGGRGGVGKSVVAMNLAVYLAQLGRRVALVDADATGAELHTMLGVTVPPRERTEDADDDGLPLVPTPVPGLLLVPQEYAVGSTVPVRPGRKPRWARRLRYLEVDAVILDLGAGTLPASLDLFLGADLGVTVTTPEPVSVEATYRFVCALFQRQVRRVLTSDRFKLRFVEQALAELPPLPPPVAMVRALARWDRALAELAARELAELTPRLVVNGTRLRADSELGFAMEDMARRFLGVSLQPVGTIEHDDSVWLSGLRQRALLIDSPTSKSARGLERMARRVLALVSSRETGRTRTPVALVAEAPNHYQVLGVPPGSTDEELRRAVKRQRELFQPGSLPLTSLLGEEERRAELRRIDEAQETLLDPVRRRAYDLSTFPESTEAEAPRDPLRDSALEAERAMLRQELSREITPETEFTGKLLAKVREARGVELEEIARSTKISVAHLRAIEAEDFAELPALVYARGFVQQLAKHLDLDPTQVARSYVRRMREWRLATGGGSPDA